MDFEFTAEIWYWKGPAPFFFVTVPENESNVIKAISGSVTYGWGVIPVKVTIGETEFKTSLFPREGKYAVPIKADVRKKEGIELGDKISVKLEISL